MRLLLALLTLACTLAASPAIAFDKANPANDVEQAYQDAKPELPSVENATSDLAGKWEAFAAKEAHEQSTATGLKGQVQGKPNCATCEAWAWNNAAYTWHLVALAAGDKKDRAGYVAGLEKSVAAYEKALACPGIEQACRDLAEKHRDGNKDELAKLAKK